MPRATVARAALWWAGAALAAHVAHEVLAERALAAEIFASVAVDFLASRARVPWYDGAARSSWKRVVVAAVVGLAATAATVLVLWAAGRARPTFASDPLSVALSIVGAAAVAVRVELLARHLPDALFRDALPPRGRAVVMVLAGAAPVALAAADRPVAVLLALSTGALSVALLRAHGAIAAIGLRFGLVLGASSVFGGVRWSSGTLAPLDAASGAPALVLSALSLLGAVFVTLRAPALAAEREPTKPDAAG